MRIFAKPKIPLKTFSPFLLVGPRIDCLLKRQVEDIWLGAKPYDITDKATKWIFGISAGLGTDINFKNLTVAPFVLADFDINESKVEFGNVYRNFQYRIFIDASYNIGKGK